MANTKKHHEHKRGQPYKFLPFTPNASEPETVFVALNKKYIFSSNLVRTFYIVRYVGLKNVKEFAQTLPESTPEEGVHRALHAEFSHAMPDFSIRDLEMCIGVLYDIEYPDYVTIPKGIHSGNRDILNSYFYVDYLFVDSARNSLPFIKQLLGKLYSESVYTCLTNLDKYNLFNSSSPLKHFGNEDELRYYVISRVVYEVPYVPVCPAFHSFNSSGDSYATQTSDHSADANSQQYSSTS
jgi:hypothetical protein